MSKAYIAGPMRGYPQFNFPAFDEAARRLRLAGWEVINPAEMDREADFHETSPSPLTPEEIRVFVRRDLDAIINRLKAEDGDVLALLPGWGVSTGAKAEVATARWAGLGFICAVRLLPLFPIIRATSWEPLAA